MGDIVKKNKFEDAINKLDYMEESEKEKSSKVVKKIVGKGEKKKNEERKTLPTYIPLSLYEKFSAINEAYGISNNAAINILIRDYVSEKQGILDNL